MPFADYDFWGGIPEGPGYAYLFGQRVNSDNSDKPLKDRVVGYFDITRKDFGKGRRLRTFAALINSHNGLKVFFRTRAELILLESTEPITYGRAYELLAGHEAFKNLPLRTGIHAGRALIHEWQENMPVLFADPEAHAALQDLGWEIGSDIHEASYALDDPDIYYPGVDEGIEPVTDDHVRLVMWAMQRELNRELRGPLGSSYATTGWHRLPAVPLTELPWRIQRALAERRRYRFKQYGIDKERWENNTWSLLDIDEDPDFVPRRWSRQ